jgi:hypothetical protein
VCAVLMLAPSSAALLVAGAGRGCQTSGGRNARKRRCLYLFLPLFRYMNYSYCVRKHKRLLNALPKPLFPSHRQHVRTALLLHLQAALPAAAPLLRPTLPPVRPSHSIKLHRDSITQHHTAPHSIETASHSIAQHLDSITQHPPQVRGAQLAEA